MKTYRKYLLATVTLLGAVNASVLSAAPNCSAHATDPDGDGWGWENGRSCVIVASAGTTSVGTGNACASASSDPDGDGWGWENGSSCRIAAATGQGNNVPSNDGSGSAPARSTCSAGAADPDGDGWGWENGSSCKIAVGGYSTSTTNSNNSTAATTSGGVAVCTTTASDFDGDGWGHENNRSCRVTAATANADSIGGENAAPPPVAAAGNGNHNGRPICLTDSSDPGHTGFGFENNRTCAVVQGVTATRYEPYLNKRNCEVWFEIHYGNYRLQNNTWASDAVYTDDWHQCIEVSGSAGNYVAKWDYNWLGRAQGDEFSVKSYPQVYYGRKTRYNVSGTVAETGLPAKLNNLPQFTVSYQFSETGNAERNVALESFFHNSCDVEETNKYFELMVWVDKPVVRIPGPQVASATISGQQWAVHTNPSLGWGYVAFVAVNPRNQGTLDWNAFIEWVRYQGPANSVPDIGNNTCMGAIEMGTETFWGTGTFTLHRFDVTRN